MKHGKLYYINIEHIKLQQSLKPPLPDAPILGVLPPLERGRQRRRRGQMLAHGLVAVLVGHEAQVDLDALGADVGPAAARRVPVAGGVGRALLGARGTVVGGVAGTGWRVRFRLDAVSRVDIFSWYFNWY